MGYEEDEVIAGIKSTVGGAVGKQTFGKTVNPKKFQVFQGVPFRTFD